MGEKPLTRPRIAHHMVFGRIVSEQRTDSLQFHAPRPRHTECRSDAAPQGIVAARSCPHENEVEIATPLHHALKRRKKFHTPPSRPIARVSSAEALDRPANGNASSKLVFAIARAI